MTSWPPQEGDPYSPPPHTHTRTRTHAYYAYYYRHTTRIHAYYYVHTCMLTHSNTDVHMHATCVNLAKQLALNQNFLRPMLTQKMYGITSLLPLHSLRQPQRQLQQRQPGTTTRAVWCGPGHQCGGAEAVLRQVAGGKREARMLDWFMSSM